MVTTQTNGENNGESVMEVCKKPIPKIVKLFENLLWVNSPSHWILKSTYFQGTFFVSMLVNTDKDGQHKKIRRSFDVDIITSRLKDIYGLASDCIDEMKTEVKTQ